MNQYEFVLGIVLIVMVASIVRTMVRQNPPKRPAAPDAEADRLRDEVKVLKERIQVLERIATDKSVMLDREIEELRHR
ncbi:MAG: hypothetical protein JO013_04200 [Alphaproteobacteria bacterium]|nr:hypothetical protein [Alphaproteobacteria bacterium]